MKRSLVVLAAEGGQTLECVLAARLDRSLAEASKLVAAGGVHVDRKRATDASQVLSVGQRLVVYSLEESAMLENLRIVHAEPTFVVVDKPPGIAVGATRQSSERSVDALLRESGYRYVGILHRLDVEASGLVVVSTHRATNAALAEQLANHTARRTYRALVAGIVKDEQGRWRSDVGGKSAATAFRVVERFEDATLLELDLETGRTHQIRLHAARAGHPILGDRRHGGPEASRLMLHAARLVLTPPRTHHPLTLEAPEPAEMATALAALRQR